MITQERLDTLKALYVSTAPNLTLDLIAEIERLQANQARLVEAAETALEFFRVKGQYGPEQRGFAQLNVEGKLRAALDRMEVKQ